jgi:dipeptidyl aminopeptidase/acylaminoacyl peptidase
MRFPRAIVLLGLPLFGAKLACNIEGPLPPPAWALASASASIVAPPVPRPDPTLVPRRVVLADADKAAVKISPDGQRIGWLAPVRGVTQVWVAPQDDVKKAQPVTQDTRGGIASWWWGFASDRIVFTQDKDGDESWHVYTVDLASHESKDVTSVDGVHAELVALSSKRTHEALVAMNDRDARYHDLYLVDLATGTRKLAQENDDGFSTWVADDDLRLRFALRPNPDASVDWVAPDVGKQKWKPFMHVPADDARTVKAVDFDKTGNILYLEDSRNRDTAALFAVDTRTSAATLVAQDPRADVGEVLLHPANKTVEAVSFDHDRLAWTIVDQAVEPDLDHLKMFGDGPPVVTSRSLDEMHWVIAYPRGDNPTHYYRYDRDPDMPGNPGKAALLFSAHEALDIAKLGTTRPVSFKSRDGLDLVAYLTLPYDPEPRDDGRPQSPLATVLLVHDGPWARDVLELDPRWQWLASRGYAVLSVEFRGSSGFGKNFANAGNLEWGGKMQDDLVDAVAWAVNEKIVDPNRVAVMGGGYGGYAVLSALAMDRSPFACGVDVGGPWSLEAYVTSMPPYRRLLAEDGARRVGDWRTEGGKKLLADRSPATHVEAIRRPLLVGQGHHDPVVNEVESAQAVESMKARKLHVTYVLYPDEGHSIVHPANRTSFASVAEVFLAQCLGGRYQPIGDDLADSSITVPAGAEFVWGLREALDRKAAIP